MKRILLLALGAKGAVESCWTCDEMTYDECASQGEYLPCELGEGGVHPDATCFFEVREVKGKLKQLCTGCKSAHACQNLMDENFRDPNEADMLNDQCRPTYQNLQGANARNGPQQSVCRTCAQTCYNELYGSSFCFGGIVSNVGKEIMVPFDTESAEYPGLQSPVDTLVLGIPTYLFLDGNLDDLACDSIEDFTHHNIYFNNDANGKLRPNAGDDIRTLDEMTYWVLQGQERSWWTNNLAEVQTVYMGRIMTGCTDNGANDDTLALSSCPAFSTAQLDFP